MAHHQRSHHVKPQAHHVEDCEAIAILVCPNLRKTKTNSKLLYLLFLTFVSSLLFLLPNLLHSSVFHYFYSLRVQQEQIAATLCSSIANGTLCCDRSSPRFDVCFMKGDIRTNSSISSVFLYSSMVPQAAEIIKPYPRKWEEDTMATVGELNLVAESELNSKSHLCDVKHDVPAIFFSTSGYTGNLYHEFNDGILPLYITAQRFNKKVVFVIQEYHTWWMTKYSDLLAQLTEYPVVDFYGDGRTHCFTEAIVGLKFHDELTVNPSLSENGESIVDFRNVLDKAYLPRIKGLIEEERDAQIAKIEGNVKPKMVILSRNGSREILNEKRIVKVAEKIGFAVETVSPGRTTELAKIYRSLNSSDVLVGVHGAAMTHLLFVRPGSVFIQVVPLGAEWAAENYYGTPARKLGLKYVGYSILPEESSLYDEYDRNNPVLNDPESVNSKGWLYTKSIYLDRQNIRLNITRFRKVLIRAYKLSVHDKGKLVNW